MGKIKFKNKKVELVFTVFAWLSLFCAIIFSIVATISTFSSSTNGKELFGYKVLMVETDSMSKSDISQDEEIFFNSGDVVIIQVLNDYSGIQVGDVITFVSYNDGSRGKTLTHKVRSIKKTASGELIGFETYGINTGVSDQAIVEPDTILGKYVGKVSDLGRLFKFFKTPAGFFLSISIPCLLLIIFFSITVGKQIGKKELSDSYDNQIEKLRNRVIDLEGKGDTVVQTNNGQTIIEGSIIDQQIQEHGEGVMQTNENETIVKNQTQQQVQEQVAIGVDNSKDQTQATYQAFIQQSAVHSEKLTELALNTLLGTINALTGTIGTLVDKVENPTLASTIETLTNAMTNMVGKMVAPSVIQPIHKEQEERIVETAATVDCRTSVAQPVEEPVQTIQKVVTVPTNNEEVVEPEAENATMMPTNDSIVELEETNAILPVDADLPEIKEEIEAERETEIQAEEEMTGLKTLTKRKKIAFNKKLLSLTSEKKEFFSDIHNELASYKIKYRISFKGITYRIGRKTLAKITVRGLTLKLHLALDVNEYPETVYFQENLEDIVAYKDVPFAVKIKSNRGKNNAIKLISSLAEKNGLVKKEEITKENILKELRQFK